MHLLILFLYYVLLSRFSFHVNIIIMYIGVYLYIIFYTHIHIYRYTIYTYTSHRNVFTRCQSVTVYSWKPVRLIKIKLLIFLFFVFLRVFKIENIMEYWIFYFIFIFYLCIMYHCTFWSRLRVLRWPETFMILWLWCYLSIFSSVNMALTW